MRGNSLKATTLILVAYIAWIVMLRADLGGDLADTVVSFFGPLPLAMAVFALADPRGGPMACLRGVLPGLIPGLVAGLMLGLALRLVMRLVALVAGLTTSFSIPGTLTVLLIFALLGGAYGPLLTAAWRSIPGFRSAPGLIGGLALAVWFWYPFSLAGIDDLSGLVSGSIIILFTTLLSGMWIGYGALLAAIMRRNGSLPVPVSDNEASRAT